MALQASAFAERKFNEVRLRIPFHNRATVCRLYDIAWLLRSSGTSIQHLPLARLVGGKQLMRLTARQMESFWGASAELASLLYQELRAETKRADAAAGRAKKEVRADEQRRTVALPA